MDRLPRPGVTAIPTSDGALDIRGIGTEEIGMLCFTEGIPLMELSPLQASLEQAFLDMTKDSVEYGTQPPATQAQPAGVPA